jgi:NarL family two-component system response regulator LiaR
MTDEKRIRVLIADDHAVVRRGLQALIDSEPGMEVVGEAEDGVDALLKVRTLKPDVILIDLVMPRKDGLEAIVEIKNEYPDARILVLTSFAEDDKVFPAIKSGALGYLLKDSSPHDLLQAIRDVYGGESSLHPTIARKLIHEISQPSDLPLAAEPLTEREVEVIRLLARGLSNEEIGERLFIVRRTVRTHVSNILGKLHLANRTQAALYALREGIANLDETE